MNEQIEKLAIQAGWDNHHSKFDTRIEKFAELIIKDCIGKIEAYHIPVGNSSSGEIACELTYDALKEIRDDIKENFGVK